MAGFGEGWDAPTPPNFGNSAIVGGSLTIVGPNGPYSATAAPGAIATSSQPNGSVGTDLAAIRQWAIADTRSTKLPLIPPGSTFLTRFQSGHGWTQSGGTVDVNNTEIVLLGSQDVKGTGGVGTSFKIDSPNTIGLDTTNRAVWALVYIDDQTTVSTVFAYLSNDNAFTNFYKIPVQITGPEVSTSGWKILEFPWGAAVATGSPTRAGINKIRLEFSPYGGTTPVARIGAVGHRLVNQYPNGVMSFCLDHCYLTHYTSARPKLDQYGYPATVYIIDNTVDSGQDTGGDLTSAQLQEMEHVHGWEISAHCTDYSTHVDITTWTAAQLDAEFSAMRSFLLSRGFKGSDQYASPSGFMSEAVSEAALTYFKGVRLAADGAGSAITGMYAPGKYRALPAIVFDSVLFPVATIKARMDIAKANGYWFIFVTHKQDPTTSAGQTISAADFASIVDYANSIGIAVRTVTDAMNLV